MTADPDVLSLRRERGLALAAIVAGAVLTLTVGGRTWASVRVEAAAGLPALPQDVTGTDLAGPLPALGLVGLAAVAAVLATRGVARALIGALVIVNGIAVAAYGVDGGVSDPTAADVDLGGRVASVSGTAWPWVAVLAGGFLALGGALVLVRGRRWSALSRRFEAPRDTSGGPSDTTGGPLDGPGAVEGGDAAAAVVAVPDMVAASGAVPVAGDGSDRAGAGAGRELWDAFDRGEDPTADRP